MKIRKASAGESELLSGLALRSKAHWGYSAEFLACCREELTIDTSRLPEAGFECFVAANGDEVLGFYALQTISDDCSELEALFVEPKHIGNGVGKALLLHARGRAAQQGSKRLTIQGDPNAMRFYEAAGARLTGERESGSIPGRFLPMFEIDLSTA